MLPFLKTLQPEGLADIWSDQELKGGDRWRDEISAALDEARIAVLLVSQSFLVAPFIRDEELPRILARQTAGALTVLPVFLSPSTVMSDEIVVRDRDARERRIELSEFQGFGSPQETLAELTHVERQRSFVRLHDRIRELAAFQSARSPGVQPNESRVTYIPFPRNRNFVGRQAYLERLHQDLQSSKPTAVTQAFTGLGGIGKTQLVLEYSYRYAQEYDVLWWIRSEKQDTRTADLTSLGRAIGVDATGPLSEVVRRTIVWLDRHDGWLLVFDNVERPDDIRDLIPKGGRGRIVITSRYSIWGAIAHTINLQLWEPGEAAAYLLQRTGLCGTPTSVSIAEKLDYLPLALAQAAAYIDETGCGFDGYLELLKSRPIETLKVRADSSLEEKVIATVWDISLDSVASRDPAAVHLLNMFAFLPPDRISRRVLIEKADRLPPVLRAMIDDRFAFDAAVGALRRLSLLETTPDGFSVHRLVQVVVRARLDNEVYRQLSETAKDLEAERDVSPEEPIPPWRHRYVLAAVLATIVIAAGALATWHRWPASELSILTKLQNEPEKIEVRPISSGCSSGATSAECAQIQEIHAHACFNLARSEAAAMAACPPVTDTAQRRLKCAAAGYAAAKSGNYFNTDKLINITENRARALYCGANMVARVAGLGDAREAIRELATIPGSPRRDELAAAAALYVANTDQLSAAERREGSRRSVEFADRGLAASSTDDPFRAGLIATQQLALDVIAALPPCKAR